MGIQGTNTYVFLDIVCLVLVLASFGIIFSLPSFFTIGTVLRSFYESQQSISHDGSEQRVLMW